MKIARVYFTPNGDRWTDIPCHETMDAGRLWALVLTEGCISSPQCVVPERSIHRLAVLELPDNGTTLTVFPGGRPN